MAIEIIHLAVALRVINVILLAYLIHFYWKSYNSIKSGFTGGLLFFSVLLFLQNVSAIYFRILSGVDYGDEISLHNTILNLIQLGGLISLVFITRK
ncbi:MAG: hypothetical protein ISS93_03525 [Candidatus Aenigmarchaeota archaeon]|nr:hypothetical protein [Candidatus Aenigmarchaeota archaeon]